MSNVIVQPGSNNEPRIDPVQIDLHVHSRHSSRPYSWFLRSAHSAECYTEPASVYKIAKLRGMNLVTLSDHDTIDGALELCAQGPDTFISEEVSARFPEDGCIVHTIVIDITEAQHREIQSLRGNVYELVSYLHHQSVEFFLCHPLSEVNRRLQPSHLERCLLMFRNLELRNGTRDVVHEECLRQILAGVSPATIARYAERHPGTPVLNPEGRYGLVGGSDDHAGLSIARAFTTFAGERSGRGVTAALRARRTSPGGSHGTTVVLEHNVYGVLGGYLANAGTLDAGRDAAVDAGGVVARGAEGSSSSSSSSLVATLEYYAERLAAAQAREEEAEHAAEHEAEQQRAVVVSAGGIAGAREERAPVGLESIPARGHTDETQHHLSRLLESVLVSTGRDAFGPFIEALASMQPIALADSLPAVAKTLIAALPALLGARWHAHDILSARRYGAGLGLRFGDDADGGRGDAHDGPRVAVLSDTLDDVNGVAIGLRRLRDAAAAAGEDLRLVTWGEGEHLHVDADGIVRIPALARHRLQDYPQMEFALPHLPSLVNYLVEERIDLIQCSTPGPVGLMGLAAARLTGIPVVGQYHTDVPEYCTRLTGDPMTGVLAGKLVGWFYGAMDRVFVPSADVASRVQQLGVAAGKVAHMPRGIDLARFRPSRRDPHAFARFGLNGEPKVLYVGRLSREKSLDALIDGFAQASAAVPEARLVIVGDGPYAAPLAERAGAQRVLFLGARTGDELATLMASSDLFVSPSETETFGNTVVEAQASGLPVVVADRGAARENMVDDVTGLVVDARRPGALAGAIQDLLTDRPRRRLMAEAAAEFAQRYDMAGAAEGTFREYRRFLRERAAAARAAEAPPVASPVPARTPPPLTPGMLDAQVVVNRAGGVA
jgi:glycosyltransferase involved in cell wall biosynthesis